MLDLFSGAGGFALGFERAGWHTAAFCDIDQASQRCLRHHWPDTPIYPDITELTRDRLESDGITGITGISGGFPCQDLSTAGAQAGMAGARSGLWSEYARIIGELMPQIIIVENVTALLSGGSGQWMGIVLRDLAALGYDAEWHCLPAAALMAQHNRDRVWIIAYPAGKRWQKGQQESRLPRAPLFNFSIAAQYFCTQGWPQWSDLPANSRAPDGIPGRLDRLRLMGNAVVPHMAEMLARVIQERLLD